MTKLDEDGCVPAFAICPYKKDCGDYGEECCKHKGLKHKVPFSCGLARALEIVAESKEKKNE